MTIIEQFAGVDFGNSFPVLANDPAEMVTIGTDFVFDALAAAGYSGGFLPAAGATIPTTGLINLARDAAPALGRTGAVTAIPLSTSLLPTFDNKGWSFLAGAKSGLRIIKAGIANNRVCEPTLEAFADTLTILWVKVTAYPTASAAQMLLFGQAGNTQSSYTNVQIAATGNLTFGQYGSGYGVSPFPLNTLAQIAIHSIWDNVADTSTHRVYRDGIFLDSRAGGAPSALLSNNTNSGATLAGSLINSAACTIHRAQREYVEVSGIDVAAFVAKDYTVNRLRFAA